jgi:hypothetical protein
MRATEERPAQPAGAIISVGLAEQQRQRERALKRLAKLKEKASAEIDRLLAFLDALDPYVTTELEVNGDELDTSYPERGPHVLANPHDEDAEPSLGSFDRMTNQSKSWQQGNLWDVPEVDAEQDDADKEDDDSGIGDMDGLLEQTGRMV